MFKRFLIGLAKTVLILAVCVGIIGTAVYFIYNAFAIDSQELIDEYEVIAQEKPVRTPPPTPVPTPRPTPKPDWPQELDVSSWEFLLANEDNSIEDYAPEKVVYYEGMLIDQRIYKAVDALVLAARQGGYSIYVSTAYMDHETTKTLYNKAGEGTRTAEIAEPGTNEHQTGLSIDFMSSSFAKKDDSAKDMPIAEWLQRNAAKYGFILRYPKGKEDITGVAYNAYHYRYVGVEAATYIMKKGICLEEFLALYETE